MNELEVARESVYRQRMLAGAAPDLLRACKVALSALEDQTVITERRNHAIGVLRLAISNAEPQDKP